MQRLDHFLDRLRAEVRNRVQFGARLAHQVADRLHAGALQAVVRTDAEFELLDQDLVEAVVGPAAFARPVRGDAVGRQRRHRFTRGQFLDPVGVGEDRQALDQDLGGLAERGARLDRAVGLEVELEFVEVGPLPDAGAGDGVGRAADRREDRVDRDDADRLLVRLVLFGGRVAAAAGGGPGGLPFWFFFERRYRRLGVEDLDAGGQVDVL